MFHLVVESGATRNQDHLHYHPLAAFVSKSFLHCPLLFQSPLCLSPNTLKLVGACLNVFDTQQFVSYSISCVHGGEVRRGICAACSGTGGEEQEEGFEDSVQEEGRDVDAFQGRCCSMFFLLAGSLEQGGGWQGLATLRVGMRRQEVCGCEAHCHQTAQDSSPRASGRPRLS